MFIIAGLKKVIVPAWSLQDAGRASAQLGIVHSGRSVKMKINKFYKAIVSLVILFNVIFTAAVLYIFFIRGSEPTALIAAWFSFTTVELWSLASIRKTKEKAKAKDDSPTI